MERNDISQAHDGVIDTVVFDVGNVLIRWDPRNLYRKLFAGDRDEMERFLSEVCDPQWNEMQDIGRSWGEAVAERTARFPAMGELIAAYDARWQEMVSGEIAANVALLRELRTGGVPLYGLTNFSDEKFAETSARFDFFRCFDDIVVSARVGVIKPDRRIFEILLERGGFRAGNALFIDDAPANIAAAEAVGFQGFLFDPAAQGGPASSAALRSRLETCGLLERERVG